MSSPHRAAAGARGPRGSPPATSSSSPAHAHARARATESPPAGPVGGVRGAGASAARTDSNGSFHPATVESVLQEVETRPRGHHTNASNGVVEPPPYPTGTGSQSDMLLPSHELRTSMSGVGGGSAAGSLRRPTPRIDTREDAMTRGVPDFNAANTFDSPSPTTPTDVGPGGALPNYAQPSPSRVSGRTKSRQVNDSPAASPATRPLASPSASLGHVKSAAVHTPNTSYFDGSTTLNGMPTVPAIELPVDLTEGSPTAAAAAATGATPQPRKSRSSRPHISIDLTAPEAVPTLGSTVVQITPSPREAGDRDVVSPAKSLSPRRAFGATSDDGESSDGNTGGGGGGKDGSSTTVTQLKSPDPLHHPDDGVIDRSWWTTIVILGFLGPILSLGNRRALETADVPLLSASDEPAACVRVVEDKWREMVARKSRYPLMRTLLSCYGWRFWLGSVTTMAGRWIMIVTPLLTKEFLFWITSDEEDSTGSFMLPFGSPRVWYGVLLVIALAVVMILTSVFVNHAYYQGVRMGNAYRSALMSLVFEKSLRCSSFARAAAATSASGGGTGQTVNLMANDTQQVFDASTFFHFVYVDPLLIVGTVAVLYVEIGISALASGGLMLLLLPLQLLVARRIGTNRREMVRYTDTRVKLVSEILAGIRVLKLYAWETPLSDKVQSVRVEEMTCIQRALLLKSFNLATLFIWPVIVSMVTFVVYVGVCNERLTVIKTIEILAFVNVLARSITVLPPAFISLAEVRVAIGRIERYLLSEELVREASSVTDEDEALQSGGGDLVTALASPSGLLPSPPLEPPALEATAASWSWERSTLIPALHDITFSVPRGRLVGVIGAVGSGKSALLNALLGELVRLDGPAGGSSTVRGRIAYMAQQAWIQNCTLKDNVLFGMPLDEARYRRAIEAAALATDLLLLPGGDATEIGERGITLSGGQRSRVSLARSVYRAPISDVYLLDDPFAAVDVGVGSTMFHQAVGSESGVLRDKTRLVVLNSHLHLLRHFDEVWVMEATPEKSGDKKGGGGGGTIVAKGTYEEIERQFPALLQQDRLKTNDDESDDDEGAGSTATPLVASSTAPAPLAMAARLNEIREERSDEFSAEGSRRSASAASGTRAPVSKQRHRLAMGNRLSQGGSAEFDVPPLVATPTVDEPRPTTAFIPTASGVETVPEQEEVAFVPTSDGTVELPIRPQTSAPAAVTAVIPDDQFESPAGDMPPTEVDDTADDDGLDSFHSRASALSPTPAMRGAPTPGPTGHHPSASRSFAPLGRGDTFNQAAPTRQGHHPYQPSVSQFQFSGTGGGGGRAHSLAHAVSFSVQMATSKKRAGVGDVSSVTPITPIAAAGTTPKSALEFPKTAAAAPPASEAPKPSPSLMTQEDRASGSIGLHLYRYYFDTAAVGHAPSLLDVDPETIPDASDDGKMVIKARTVSHTPITPKPASSDPSTPSATDADSLDVDDSTSILPPVDPESRRVVSQTWSGLLIFFGIVCVFLVCQTVRIGCDLWLTFWGNEQSDGTKAIRKGEAYSQHSLLYWIIGCIIVTSAAIIFVAFRAWLFVRVALRASDRMHRILFRRLLLAPITTFYDTTPMGRIINRFSKDFDQVDSFLPDLMAQLFHHTCNLLGGLIVSVVSTPLFGAVLAPILFAFVRVQSYFRLSSRELKRLEGVTRSPIFSTFSETLQGLATIRAYRAEHEFVAKQRRAIRTNSKLYASFYLTSRWLSLRLDLISNVLVLAVGLFGVFLRSSLDSSLIGLALLYTLQFTGFLQFAVRVSVDAENSMTSVERLSHYHHLPSEAAYVVPASQAAPEGWPNKGEIIFTDLKLRYRPELPLVLRGVTAAIRPREKIGICGRTGSGKSSLMVSLFRIVESARGSIVIDGVDISLIGLKELRSSISIIPQDPVLFSGTIRSNLDPFGERSEEQLWTTLRQVSMSTFVSSLSLGLDAHVAEFGDNFSAGQRQLICIARALLRASRIIVLDEATAAVDNETDALIQKTIKESFADCTVLTIAHRLNTIMDSTRVMVLDAGRLAEFDTPQNLINKPSVEPHMEWEDTANDNGGLFATMVRTADGVKQE